MSTDKETDQITETIADLNGFDDPVKDTKDEAVAPVDGEDTKAVPDVDNSLEAQDEADIDIEVRERRTFGPAPVHQNVTLTLPVYGELKKGDGGLVDKFPISAVPKRQHRMVKDVFGEWTVNDNEKHNTAAVNDHVTKYQNAQGMLHAPTSIPGAGTFETALDDEEKQWEQGIEHGGRNISCRRPKNHDRTFTEDVRITGQSVLDIIAFRQGRGIAHESVLSHSGYHARYAARPDEDLLALETAVALDRVKAGHNTSGLVFANSQYAMVEKVSTFIFESFLSTNIKNWEDIEFSKITLITDLPLMYLGAAATIFPNGYPLELPCSNDPGKCQHVEQVNLNLFNILWFNRNALTNTQMNHLAKIGKDKITIEDIEKYQAGGIRELTRRRKVSEELDIDIVMSVPTVDEYLTAGREFVDDCQRSLTRLISNTSSSMNEDQKRTFIANTMNLSHLREYSHWIKEMYIAGGHVTGNEDILAALQSLSSNSEVSNKIFEEVQRYIEHSTNAIVAIPNFSCPVCGFDYATEENTKHPELVPLNGLRLFFDLGGRSLLRRSRQLM